MSLTEALSIANELLDELQEDLGSGMLSKEEIVGVLAEDNVIIDYYYNDEWERKNLLAPIKSWETAKEFQQRKAAWKQYKEDKPRLVYVTVQQLIFELNAFINYFQPKE